MNQEQHEKGIGSTAETRRTSLLRHLKHTARRCVQPCSSTSQFLATARSFVPIARWLPHYDIRQNLIPDVIGGITTGIIHVPAGLAYSVLAGVDPVDGLYSSFFPALFYMLFGTSKHCAIGPFAVIALMAGVANDNIMRQHYGAIGAGNTTIVGDLTPIQVASTLTVALGVVQFAAGLLRLEFLLSYFSDPLISGFTTGSAVHVFVAQIGDIFGLTDLPKASGPGHIFKRSWDVIMAAVERTNQVALVMSVIAIAFLHCGRAYLSPFLKKKGLALPVPYELIVIIIATAVSTIFDFQNNYSVPVVIPTGPPTPALPVFAILPNCIIQSFGMVIVSIAVHISLAKMYAKKVNYDVDSRQEFYALGASSMLSGLFSVYPVCTAIGTTAVNVATGTKTQLSTVFSCALLLVIILWLGPLLEALPTCILACIIIVAIKTMFQRGDELKSLWRICRADLAVWIVAFSATVAIDVFEGLVVSIVFALVTVVFRTQWSKWMAMSCGKYEAIATETPLTHRSICVFRLDAPLIFTNVERFDREIKKTIDESTESPHHKLCGITVQSGKDQKQHADPLPRFFIIDCASMAFIDYMGMHALSEAVIDLEKREFNVYLAAVKPEALAVLKAAGLLDKLSQHRLFLNLHDAISVAERNV